MGATSWPGRESSGSASRRRCGSRRTATSGSSRRQWPGSTPKAAAAVVALPVTAPDGRRGAGVPGVATGPVGQDVGRRDARRSRRPCSERIDVLGVNDVTFTLLRPRRRKVRGWGRGLRAGAVAAQDQGGRGKPRACSLAPEEGVWSTKKASLVGARRIAPRPPGTCRSPECGWPSRPSPSTGCGAHDAPVLPATLPDAPLTARSAWSQLSSSPDRRRQRPTGSGCRTRP